MLSPDSYRERLSIGSKGTVKPAGSCIVLRSKAKLFGWVLANLPPLIQIEVRPGVLPRGHDNNNDGRGQTPGIRNNEETLVVGKPAEGSVAFFPFLLVSRRARSI